MLITTPILPPATPTVIFFVAARVWHAIIAEAAVAAFWAVAADLAAVGAVAVVAKGMTAA